MASRSLTTFAGRSIWCRSSSGPCRPTHSADGTTAAHVTLAADRPWNCHHSPFASCEPHMPSRPGSASASPLGSHVYRRVLRELDIEGCASSTCAIASESHRIASGTWTRQLCASFQQASAGGPRGPSQPMSSLRAPSSRSHLLRT